MGVSLEEVRHRISADDQATAVIKGVASSFDSLGGTVGKLQGALTALGGALGVTGFAVLLQNMALGVSEMERMRIRTGAAAEQISRFSQIAKLSGTDMGTVETALIRLSRGMAGSDVETKGAGRALEFLGVSARNANGDFKDSGAVLNEIALALDKYADGAGKTAIAMDLFGKGGAAILPMLKDMAELSGIVAKVTADQMASANEYEKTLKRLQLTKEVYIRQLAIEAIPTMTAFVTALLEAKKQGDAVGETVKKLKDDGSVSSWAEDGGRMLAFLVDALRGVVAAVQIVGRAFAAAAVDVKHWMDIMSLGGGNWSKFQEGVQHFAGGGVGGAFQEDLDRITGDYTRNSFQDRFESALTRAKALAKKPVKPSLNYTSKDAPGAKGGDAEAESYMQALARSLQEQSKIEDEARKLFADAELRHKAELEGEEAALDTLKQKYIDLLDPIEKYRRMLDEIDKLEGTGRLDANQALEARWDVQMKIDKAMEGTVEKVKESNQWAHQLGLTFTSAFENAVAGGKSLRDVFAGLLGDIAKLVLRLGVTQPLGEALTSKLKGSGIDSMFSGLFGGRNSSAGASSAEMGFATGGSFRVGGSGGTDSQFVGFRATPGEMVDVRTPGQTRAGGDVNISINFAGGEPTDPQAFLAQVVPVMKSVARGEIQTQLRNGGVLHGA